jgi:hypothetical protein
MRTAPHGTTFSKFPSHVLLAPQHRGSVGRRTPSQPRLDVQQRRRHQRCFWSAFRSSPPCPSAARSTRSSSMQFVVLNDRPSSLNTPAGARSAFSKPSSRLAAADAFTSASSPDPLQGRLAHLRARRRPRHGAAKAWLPDQNGAKQWEILRRLRTGADATRNRGRTPFCARVLRSPHSDREHAPLVSRGSTWRCCRPACLEPWRPGHSAPEVASR